jgi:hypothetical protein
VSAAGFKDGDRSIPGTGNSLSSGLKEILAAGVEQTPGFVLNRRWEVEIIACSEMSVGAFRKSAAITGIARTKSLTALGTGISGEPEFQE